MPLDIEELVESAPTSDQFVHNQDRRKAADPESFATNSRTGSESEKTFEKRVATKYSCGQNSSAPNRRSPRAKESRRRKPPRSPDVSTTCRRDARKSISSTKITLESTTHESQSSCGSSISKSEFPTSVSMSVETANPDPSFVFPPQNVANHITPDGKPLNQQKFLWLLLHGHLKKVRPRFVRNFSVLCVLLGLTLVVALICNTVSLMLVFDRNSTRFRSNQSSIVK